MRTVAIAAILLLIATPAAALDTIGIFADPAGQDCRLFDTIGSPLTWYVVLYTQGAEAAAFAAPVPLCMNGAVFLNATPPCIDCITGSIPEGAWSFFGQCLSGSVTVAGITFFIPVGSSSCCPYPLLPNPGVSATDVVVMDCNQNQGPAIVQTNFVNPNATCVCDGALPVEAKTWGGVKSLYGD